VVVGTQTLARTGFDEHRWQIDNEALRDIYFGVRSTIDDLAGQAWEKLAVSLRAAVDVELYVELPGRFTGQLGRTLYTVDLAWRLGWMIAEMEEAELPSGGGSTNLDQLLLIEMLGLEVKGIEIGSLKAWLRKNGSFNNVLATLGVIVQLGGFNAHDALFAEAQQVGGSSCQVQVTGQLDEQASRAIQNQLPGLPANCQVKAKIELSDGTVIYANVPANALPDR